MKDSSTNTLFSLLRAALGNEAVGALPSYIDWKEVIDLSFEQGVAAIAVDGLGFAHDDDNQERLELALDSPELEDLKYEWFGSVFQAEEDYKKYVEDWKFRSSLTPSAKIALTPENYFILTPSASE